MGNSKSKPAKDGDKKKNKKDAKKAKKETPKTVAISEEPPKVIEDNVPKVEEATDPTSKTEEIVAEVISEKSSHATLASKKLIDLYYLPPSPPCRAVMMTAKAIGIELNLIVCNILEGDHMKEEYVKMNPQHCIPTMDDNGFIMWESRAIMGYLVSQYAKNDSLYPSSPRERAIVDQRLYFDAGTLFPKIAEYYFPVIFAGVPLNPEKLKAMDDAIAIFNTILDGETFCAGKNLTIADISLAVTISNIEAFGYNLSTYPNIESWFARTKEALAPCGYEEINQSGADMLGGMMKEKIR